MLAPPPKDEFKAVTFPVKAEGPATPEKPVIVRVGLHIRSRSTLVVNEMVTVLLSQGNGEDCHAKNEDKLRADTPSGQTKATGLT